MEENYNCFVIGSGVAGRTAAETCRAAGLKVAIADSGPIGGVCIHRGCHPKRVILGASEIAGRSSLMQGKGLLPESRIVWGDLIRFKNTLTHPYADTIESQYSRSGIDIFHGHCRFTGENKIDVDGRAVTADKIIIATGSSPRSLGIEGEQYITTSTEFLESEELPDSVIFIGGGYISFELAHAAVSSGCSVKILESGENPLSAHDSDLVEILLTSAREEGIEVHVNCPVTSIDMLTGLPLAISNGRSFQAHMIVHGAGRLPFYEGLELEKAGIDQENGIKVNEFLQSVSNPSVYVAGDALPKKVQLTPLGVMEGRTAALNLMNGNRHKPNYTAVPHVLFTYPKLSSVGLTEHQAQSENLDYEVSFNETSSWNASRLLDLGRSGYKVLTDKSTRQIIGAHLLGHNSDEVINIFALAIKHNLTVKDLRETLWTYPTLSYNINYMLPEPTGEKVSEEKEYASGRGDLVHG